jgi:hypothetical protein
MAPDSFVPRLDILPRSQRLLWDELRFTPDAFTLYGGTALALRLGHRNSVDFDFFSDRPFDPDRLGREVPYLQGAERVQVDANTLTCRVDRDGPVLVSFFGDLDLRQVAPPGRAHGIAVASLLDIAGTKAAVIQKRAQAKDYLDIDALIRHGTDLPTILAAGTAVHGRGFNALITLKALSYFDDVPKLPAAVDPTKLPVLSGAANGEAP